MSLSNFLCAILVSLLQFLNYICCKHDDTFGCCGGGRAIRRCLASLQPVLQTAFACLCYVVVVVLYFVFFDRQGLVVRGRNGAKELAWARVKLFVACLIALMLVIVLLALVAFTGGTGSAAVYNYGVFAEVTASIMLVSHWFLQMWETWSVQSIGSLSIFGLMVGCIGNLLNAYSLGIHGGFTVAASNLVAGLMIGCTCALGIYVEKIRCPAQRDVCLIGSGVNDFSPAKAANTDT